MPRPRTPLGQAEATGAIEKNKKRFAGRIKTPKYGGTLGPAPMHFSPERVMLWDELVAKIPDNVLASADCYIVEIAVVLMEKFRNAFRPYKYDPDDPDAPRPVPMTATEIGHLRAALGSLGMTPADRTRVNPAGDDGEKQRDPLDILLGANGFGKAAN